MIICCYAAQKAKSSDFYLADSIIQMKISTIFKTYIPFSWVLFIDFTISFALCPHFFLLSTFIDFTTFALLDVQTLLSVFLFHLLILEYGLQDEQAAFETKKVSFFALVISRVK